MRDRTSDAEWWKAWFTFLREVYEEVEANQVDQPAGGAWSINKLAFVASYAREVFHTVGSKHFHQLFYVDLLAGDGLTSVEDRQGTEHTIAGSSLGIPSLGAFDQVFVNDKSDSRIEALQQRVEELRAHRDLPPYNYYSDDANNVVDDIISDIWDAQDGGSFLVLTFIDNQGFNVHLETVAKLSDLFNDIFILFPTSEFIRNYEHLGGEGISSEALDRFFGGDYWTKVESGEEGRKLYTGRVTEAGARERLAGPQPKIRGKKSHHYHLISSVRKTSNDSGFLRGAEHLAERVDDMEWGDLIMNLDVASGRQASILGKDFLRESSSEAEQQKLTDF